MKLISLLSRLLLACAVLTALSGCDSSSSRTGSTTPIPPPAPEPATPNILFVIMDDVGVDQMPSMGYGGLIAPEMPSIDAIADGGIRFRNTWSMPECSPGRSALMTGRYPMRNNINQAIGPNDLANSQIDPWEMTVSKVLATAGYTSGMFGKFHLAGPEHNEAGNGTPKQLGWDHFYGWTGGLPGSIDTTAGGVAPAGTYSCGFVPDETRANGAYSGACYVPTSGGASCEVIAGANAAGDSAGLQCLTRGGVLNPGAVCEASPPPGLIFNRQNAHYVSPLVVNSNGAVEEADLLDARGRGYRSTIEVNAAIDWIKRQSASNKPWMATVSFSSAHTPLQHPPGNLVPSGLNRRLSDDCTDPINQRLISDAMIEAMDTELGRLLVETNIATRKDDGSLLYDPAATDTMVVVVGDNGSFGTLVKAPFDPSRAKGTAYQTGVWVPLIVAGPLVTDPNRDVEHMVNATDVFRLFSEIAEIDVAQAVPRGVDAAPLMPYLTNPAQTSIRDINFTQGGLNIQANGGRNGPCVFFGNSCSHTPVSKNVCEDNGGTWWGVGADAPSVLKPNLEQCWQVNQAIYAHDPVNYSTNRIAMGATHYQAVRNEHYKLVVNKALDYHIATDSGEEVVTEELYRIDQDRIAPQLDRAGRNLLAGVLTPDEQANYDILKTQLNSLLASQIACPGDGDGNGVVDVKDVANYTAINASWGLSSAYDFNFDGVTDAQDLQIINDNMGACPR